MPVWPTDRDRLYAIGVKKIADFCEHNDLPVPTVNNVPQGKWLVGSCAYYRPDTPAARKYSHPGINLCLKLCGLPCGAAPSRNWTWPGSTVDREPCGVLTHELGHHVDWLTGDKKGSYFSDFSEKSKRACAEPGLTSYADTNPAEWFAEAFRLFVLNPNLLSWVRPRTYKLLRSKWRYTETRDWLSVLGKNVPDRVVASLRNKGAK